jgi:hypothetical protein
MLGCKHGFLDQPLPKKSQLEVVCGYKDMDLGTKEKQVPRQAQPSLSHLGELTIPLLM